MFHEAKRQVWSPETGHGACTAVLTGWTLEMIKLSNQVRRERQVPYDATYHVESGKYNTNGIVSEADLRMDSAVPREGKGGIRMG